TDGFVYMLTGGAGALTLSCRKAAWNHGGCTGEGRCWISTSGAKAPRQYSPYRKTKDRLRAFQGRSQSNAPVPIVTAIWESSVPNRRSRFPCKRLMDGA